MSLSRFFNQLFSVGLICNCNYNCAAVNSPCAEATILVIKMAILVIKTTDFVTKTTALVLKTTVFAARHNTECSCPMNAIVITLL